MNHYLECIFSLKATQEVLPSIVCHGNMYFLKFAKVTFQSYDRLQKDSLRKQWNNCCPAKKLKDKKAVITAAGFVLLFFLWMERKPHSFFKQLHLCCRCHNECQVKAASRSNWSSSFQGTGKQQIQLLSDQSRNTFAQCVRLQMIELPQAVTFLQGCSFLLHKKAPELHGKYGKLSATFLYSGRRRSFCKYFLQD